MSTTISAVAGTTGTGLGTSRHVVYAINDGAWWAFAYTGTQVLSTWRSTDRVTWTAGATHTLAFAHSSEGRNFTVVVIDFNGLDVVHVGYVSKYSGSNMRTYAVRATISAGTLTWHATDTQVQSASQNDLDNANWYGQSAEFSTDNRVFFASGFNFSNGGTYDYGTHNARSTVDPGTAESTTPVTWTLQDVDSHIPNGEGRSAYLAQLSGGDMGLVCDNGSASLTTTALSWYRWNGASWAGTDGNSDVTGVITAIDKDDWGAVRVSETSAHVVYRSGANTLVHRHWDGASWGAGQTIPNQTCKAGSGIAMASDGWNVFLAVIDSDSANTVRWILWDGFQQAWQTWTALETSSATRTFLGCTKSAGQSANAVIYYWTEGSDFVVQALDTANIDPPGSSGRRAISATASSTTSTLTITFTGAQPVAGDEIKVGFVASAFTGSPTATVVDNATVQNTYVSVANRIRGGVQGAWIYQLDLPSTATWPGNYTITVTLTGGPLEFGGGAIAYSGISLGAALATNNNGGASGTMTPGAVNSPSGSSTYFAICTDDTISNPATFSWAAPYTKQISQTNGSAQQAFSIADAINQSGSQNPSVAGNNTTWDACQAVWVNAADVGGAPPRVPVWKMLQERRFYGGLAAAQLQLLAFRMQPRARQMTDVAAAPADAGTATITYGYGSN